MNKKRVPRCRLWRKFTKEPRPLLFGLGMKSTRHTHCTLHDLRQKRWDFTPRGGTLDRAKIRQLRNPEWNINWKSVERLLLRPWWRRVWTLQEFLICDKLTFYCGKETISRESFHVAMYVLWALGATDGSLMNAKAFYAGWNRRRMSHWYRMRREEMDSSRCWPM